MAGAAGRRAAARIQPNAPAPQKIAQDRRGQQQVAAEDRQPGGGEAGRTRRAPSTAAAIARRRARSRSHSERRQAARGAEEHRLAEDLADPPRHRPRHVVEAGDRAAASRAVSRVPVSEWSGSPATTQVAQRPQQRAGGGERRERRERAEVARVPPQVRRGRRPRTATPPAAAGRRRRAARAPARRRAARARLDEQRAEHEHEVRDVDVGPRAEVEHRPAREDDRRREDPGPGPNQSRAELVDHPAAARRARGSRRARP